jgi:hypothetical protein
MAIVIVQFWREIGPLRAEVKALRAEVGKLVVEDESRIHAVQAPNTDEGFWKWRVWIPKGVSVRLKCSSGKVPKTGVPSNHTGMTLQPGEQVITYRLQRRAQDGTWMTRVDINGSSYSGTSLQDSEVWLDWPQKAGSRGGVGTTTVSFNDEDRQMILSRNRVAPFNNSLDVEKLEATTGFIICLERQ